MQDDRIEHALIVDYTGKPIQNAHILRDVNAADARRKFGLAHRVNNDNNYRRTNLEDHVSGGMFIELEQANAQITAQQLLGTQEIPSSGTVPILYPPDGGLHVAYGLKRGIEWSSDAKGEVLSTGPGNELPKQAIELAKKSGTLVLCDSVVASGGTFEELLEQLRPYQQELKDSNVNIVVYSVFAYETPRRNATDQANGHYVPSISELCKQFDDLNMSVYLSDVGANHFLDGPERGDVVMYTNHPHTEVLWDKLEKRVPPYEHGVPYADTSSATAEELKSERLTDAQLKDVCDHLPGLDEKELDQVAKGDDWVLRTLATKSRTPMSR